MSPPERTFGPIGWKGLFGDDEESDDETSTDAEGSADTEGRETAGGTGSTDSRRRESPEDPSSGGTDQFVHGTVSESATASETETAIREKRSRRVGELSEGDADATDAEDDPLDEWRTLDELSEDERPDDADETPDGTGTGAAAGSAPAGTRGRDATESAGGPRRDVGDRGGIGNAESPPREPRVRTEQSDAVPTGGARQEPATRAESPDATSARREPADAASPPGEPRVRTERSDTEPEPEASTSEKTFGPIGLKWFSDDEGESDNQAVHAEETQSWTDETAIARTGDVGRAAGTVDLDQHRSPARDGTATEEEAGLADRVPGWISVTAIGVGVGLLVFLDIVSMMVPLIAAIGAGIVGGFVAGYIAGGTVRGAAHALVVGVVGGIAVGYLTALIGALIGLFLEPATLLGSQVGPIAPDLGTFGSWGPLMVMVFVTAMVAIDATIGGVVGGTLRSMVDEVR